MDRTLHIDSLSLKLMADAAERAYPHEACGLLVGHVEGGGAWHVAEAVESPNLAPAGQTDRFEIDPALRLALQRQARARGAAVIGIWHSHPDGPARPSATDLAGAWEAGLAWVLVQVVAGQVVRTTAHCLATDGSRFLPIAIADGPGAAPVCAPRLLDDLGRLGKGGVGTR